MRFGVRERLRDKLRRLARDLGFGERVRERLRELRLPRLRFGESLSELELDDELDEELDRPRLFRLHVGVT